MKYKLKDEVWARVVQIVQLAMLTNTDVTDYLRQIEVYDVDGDLGLTDEYNVLFERTLEQLTERLVELQASAAGYAAVEESMIVDQSGNEVPVQFPSVEEASMDKPLIGIMPPLTEEEKNPR